MTDDLELRDLRAEERRAFLDEGSLTAVVTTTRVDGRPHAAPVGFVTDGDDVLFLTDPRSVKARNIRRDPRVAVAIAEHAFPFRFVLVEGIATIEHDAGRIAEVNRRTWRRYAGTEPPDAGAMELVRVRPGKVIARSHG